MMELFKQYDPEQPVTFEQALSIWQNDQINSPGYNKTGLYNNDEFNTGGFLWFDSEQDLRFFLVNVWPVVMVRDDLDTAQMEAWEEYARNFPEDMSDYEKVIEYVSGNWQSDIHLGWLGTLEELESGTGEVPLQIRDWFQESEEPVQDKDKKRFCEFVKRGFA